MKQHLTYKHKIYLAVLTVVLQPFFAFTQVQWDSTYRPEIFNPRVEFFRLLPRSEKDTIFLGDSITFWGDWPEMLQNKHIKNRGIPGDITYGVLERLKYIIEGKPSAVFILIGINDLARNIPDTIIIQNHIRMIEAIQTGSPETKIYIQSILPVNATFNKLSNHTGKKDNINRINEQLKHLAVAKKVEFIDLYPYLADSEGRLKKEYSWDGVHLTAEGYKHWLNMLKSNHYIR